MNHLSTILSVFTGFIIIISCNNAQSYPTANTGQVQVPVTDSEARPRPKTAAELRRELAETEASNPAGMLSVTGNLQENKILIQKPDLFHHSKYATDGYLINGIITNKASIATFKDAVVRVTFFTDTNTELATKDCSVYKYFSPHEATSFELKVYPPENTKNFNLQVISAIAVNQ